MSNSKKTISLLLSVIMIMSVFNIVPLGVSAAEAEITETGAESGTTGDCTWSLDNGVLTISGNGEMGDYDSTYKNGSWVTTAPWGGYDFDAVTIEDGVKSIGSYAFYKCTGLTSVNIPDSVTSIGESAFYKCTGLTSVTIGNSVTSIGNSAFDGCTGLMSVDIPDSVTSIGDVAFYGCTGLTSIDIPDSVTYIGWYAFEGCTGLTSVDIPDSVTSIGSSAFEYTAWYNNQPDGLVYAGKVAYKMKGDCPSEVVIKDGTLSIADYAFSGCTSLTSIDIPDSVTSIGEYAFRGCKGLTSVTIPDSVTSIGYRAFGYYNVSSNQVVKVNDFTIYGKAGSKAERYAKNNGFTFTALDEPEVNSGATGECTWEIKDGVLTISGNGKMGDYDYSGNAPWRNYSFNTVVIENGVTSIGSEAFYGCESLMSVTIPGSVTSIDDEAFRGCTGLTGIDIPDSVTSIGVSTFYNCTGLTSIKVAEGNTVYDSRNDCNAIINTESNKLIYGCKNTVIPDSVTSIGGSAFSGCTGMSSITIPDSVTSIGGGAFSGCTGLTSIDIPDSVTSIGNYTFSHCTSLTSVTIGSSVTSIGGFAFFRCIGLTSVTIPDSVTNIRLDAFSGCTSLTSVTIPDSVTSVGDRAFGYCYDEENPHNKKINDFTIYGKVGSEAERYAKDNGFTFTALDEPEVNSGTTGDCTWTLDNGVLTISGNGEMGNYYSYSTLPWGKSIKTVVIENGVTSIGGCAFCGCTGLTSIDIPDSVTSIDSYTFRGCTNLTSVTIPDSVTSIDGYAFYNTAWYNNQPYGLVYAGKVAYEMKGTCPSEVVIKDGTLGIADYAFYDCTELKSVDIPDSVTSIGLGAFSGCTGLTSVTIPDSVTSVGFRAFGYDYDHDSYEFKKIDDFTIYGKEGSEAERYANDNGFSFKSGATVKGTVTSYIGDSDVTVKLTGTDNNFTAEVKGTDSYEIAAVPAGKYTMTVSKANHVTAEYSVTVAGADVTQDVEIFPLGDVTGDGKTNVQDCTAILRYVRQIDALSDEQLKIGDVTGDGKVNVQDVTRILRHVRQIEALY